MQFCRLNDDTPAIKDEVKRIDLLVIDGTNLALSLFD